MICTKYPPLNLQFLYHIFNCFTLPVIFLSASFLADPSSERWSCKWWRKWVLVLLSHLGSPFLSLFARGSSLFLSDSSWWLFQRFNNRFVFRVFSILWIYLWMIQVSSPNSLFSFERSLIPKFCYLASSLYWEISCRICLFWYQLFFFLFIRFCQHITIFWVSRVRDDLVFDWECSYSGICCLCFLLFVQKFFFSLFSILSSHFISNIYVSCLSLRSRSSVSLHLGGVSAHCKDEFPHHIYCFGHSKVL